MKTINKICWLVFKRINVPEQWKGVKKAVVDNMYLDFYVASSKILSEALLTNINNVVA